MVRCGIVFFLTLLSVSLIACTANHINTLNVIKLYEADEAQSELIRLIVVNKESVKYKLTKVDSDTLGDSKGYPPYQIIELINTRPIVEYKRAKYSVDGTIVSTSKGTIVSNLKKGHCYLVSKQPAVKSKFIERVILQDMGPLNDKGCMEILEDQSNAQNIKKLG